MSEFYLTQTSLKDLENEDTCPFRWKSQWLDRLIPFQSSEHMEKGKYFEQLLLGSGAIAGDDVVDLKRLLNGEKSSDQKRIEEQVERVKGMLFDTNSPEYLGLSVVSTQLELIIDGEKGTYDVEAIDEEQCPWLIDIKLTKDLTSTRSKYSWGNDWYSMDYVQLVHYQDLYFKTFGKRPRVGYLVVDYSTQKRVVFKEIVVTNLKLEEKVNRFSAGKLTIDMYNKHGWIKIPNIKECGSCPLTCESRQFI